MLLQAVQQKRLSGARGALGSFLEVPAELETAIAAALGEFLDAVLLEGADADDALELLLAGRCAGRWCRCKALSAGQGAGRRASRGMRRWAGPAELVETPDNLRPLIESIIGRRRWWCATGLPPAARPRRCARQGSCLPGR